MMRNFAPRRPVFVTSTNTSAKTFVSSLEPRVMLYSFTLTDGTLRLTCDPTSQSLDVALVGSNIKATLTEGNTLITQQQWTSSSVSSFIIFLDDGDDKLTMSNSIKQPAAIGGDDGNDTLQGGGGNDQIAGGPGNDILDGQGGGDSMFGNGGNDTVDYSHRTHDLYVEPNDNQISDDGEKGEGDRVWIDIGIIQCGSGNDVVHGNRNSNVIYGGVGKDTLYGGAGDDLIYGGGDDDLIYGESGRDKIYGDTGSDRIFGGSQNDTIKGGKGRDRLYGQDGNDKMYDNDNAIDILDGGAGTDGLDVDRDDVIYNIP